MELIKENKENRRSVYFCGDRYKKVWEDREDWIYKHVKLLNQVVPGYIINYGNNYIEYSIIEGYPASVVKHNDEFIKKIYKFCLKTIEDTNPWVHGDWVLSNIIIQPDGNMKMVDWDNLGIYREVDYVNKLHNDLISAFGEERFKRVINDSAGI